MSLEFFDLFHESLFFSPPQQVCRVSLQHRTDPVHSFPLPVTERTPAELQLAYCTPSWRCNSSVRNPAPTIS